MESESDASKGGIEMSERKFFDDTTYDSPAMFLDHATNELWHGPVMRESNMHWGKCEGYHVNGTPIFVYRCSELPDGDYIRIKTSNPKTRDELVQDLLDAVDAFNEIGGAGDWTDVMNAREKLK